MTKPAVQYAAQDFRNLTSTLVGMDNSAISFEVVPVVARRAAFPIGTLKTSINPFESLSLFLLSRSIIFIH